MYNLAISLGHNSSAILIEDGRVLAGYEEERFTGMKADSHYPVQAIEELKTRFKLPKDTNTYVGHWFLDALLADPNKYWTPQHIRDSFPNGHIDSLSQDFTHHDSHIESAMVFASREFAGRYTAIVADGFGSFGECISIYEVTGAAYRLLNRSFGFEKSLGMLYQYATAFMGMKMHNHEYKMLAYEVHLPEVLSWSDIQNLREHISETSREYLRRMHTLTLSSEFDPITDLSALPNVQMSINGLLTDVLTRLDMQDSDIYDKRVIISYFVQHVVESVICTLVEFHNTGPILAVGGLFYNVKINHLLANMAKGRFCAMPLAGDQGAALGVYQAYKGDLVWPETLNWGKRDLKFDKTNLPKGVILVPNEGEAQRVMTRKLSESGWVNLVRGDMEFGPRALCNTSTVAVPSKDVASDINRANNRTMEMPFAPVMTKDQADDFFLDCNKVHKSLEYMIVARTYRKGMGEKVPGAAHYYPEEKVYTGRPQITADPLMVNLLNEYGPLVNTSFNFHGVPIVRSPEQILATHVSQRETAPDLEPITVIVTGEEP
jgi:carbamoyltransferase